MKIHILNDLHIEFKDFTPPVTDADVVVLAGDIGVGMEGLRWAEDRFFGRTVIYVPGNHEFYHHDIALGEQLKEAASRFVHVLNNDSVVIDGVRFLGCVLWTDFALFVEVDKFASIQLAPIRMPDFSIVHNSDRLFTPRDAIQLHTTSRDWLKTMLAEPFAGKTVVVTHHAPSSMSVHSRYGRDLLSPAFASNLEYLLGSKRVVLWVHGHMHDAFDYEIEGTRVVCNPRGYAPNDLTPDFKPACVVRI